MLEKTKDKSEAISMIAKISENSFQGHLGIKIKDIGEEWALSEMEIQPIFLNPNGVVHGGCITSFADTCAGDSVMLNLPEGAKGFTTLEFKCNFVSAAKSGVLLAKSKAVHLGRSTHVWNVEVTQKDTGKTIASFNCTQMIVY